MESLLPGKPISIRQTRDAYVRDVEYIAYAEAPIDERGRLDMTNLGMGAPGDVFFVIRWEQKRYPRWTDTHLLEDGFVQPWALRIYMAVGEDSRPVITVIETHDFERSRRRNELMRAEASRQRDLKFWADIRKMIFTPVTWIREANEPRTIRKVHEEPLPYSQPESDSSLAVVWKSPMDPGQHNGIGGLNDETASRIPKRRLVAGKVDKADTEEL